MFSLIQWGLIETNKFKKACYRSYKTRNKNSETKTITIDFSRVKYMKEFPLLVASLALCKIFVIY